MLLTQKAPCSERAASKRPASSPLRPEKDPAKRLAWATASPTRPPRDCRSDNYSDRFIPCRDRSVGVAAREKLLERSAFESLHGNESNQQNKPQTTDPKRMTYNLLLKNELLGTRLEDFKDHQEQFRIGNSTRQPLDRDNLFRFKEAKRRNSGHSAQSPYSLTPVSIESQRLLMAPTKEARNVSKTPFKVLDAPDLQDDFYLNLLDWSSQNVICVGLGSSAYLWSAGTCKVTKLCDLTLTDDSVTSVNFLNRGSQLALGTSNGLVHIWDCQASKRIRTMRGHTARVGSLAGLGNSVVSGSRDCSILWRDVRKPGDFVQKMKPHEHEVCGLKWAPDETHLASGGNDNKLLVFRAGYNNPVQRFLGHCAAVKAIAWSPHQHGLLASGGGTADQTIRFWNTVTGAPLQVVDTKSQVCNLAWSKTANEIVSTHGYSQNQILLWKCPSMTQVAKLTGHSCRVLYLGMSPDGQTIVTGAGDETLRFWNVFKKPTSARLPTSVLVPFTHIR
eukprot:m.11930 g.11930  ORF g.11930 m.11930 type:complete len:504 (+) comp4559_c0_seq1:190-1701(+)